MPEPTPRDERFLSDGDDAIDALSALIAQGQRAIGKMPGLERPDGTFVHDPRIGQRAAVSGSISLSAATAWQGEMAQRALPPPPAPTPAGETQSLAWSVRGASRVISAGAHMIEMAPPSLRGDGDGQPIMVDEPQRFKIVEPGIVGALSLTGTGNDAEGTVSASSLPVATATLDRTSLTQRAVRFSIPRSDLKARGEREVSEEVAVAIALGLGRALDAEMLGALVPQASAGFTPAAAAAKGLKWGELRALVGTNGAGVALSETPVTGDGLHVHGVPGQLAPDMAETLVGAWDRFAIAVEPELQVLVERSLSGGVAVTLFADMQALIPDPSFAWTVA